MSGSWIAGPGYLAVVGSFGDVQPHHHPAVQISTGIGGDVELTDGDGVAHRCSAVVVASGIRHAMRSAGAGASLSVYYSPETPIAAALNARMRTTAGGGALILVQPLDTETPIRGAVADGDLAAAADLLLDGVLGRTRPAMGTEVHAQLGEAIAAVADTVPGRAALRDIAGEVALSPDYLGRLFRVQTGTSFAATVRWRRLLTALGHAADGASVTDAAHLAGFADGAHATRTCRELTGAAPSVIVRALR